THQVKARYIPPELTKTHPRAAATDLATVLLPEAAGPSIATIRGMGPLMMRYREPCSPRWQRIFPVALSGQKPLAPMRDALYGRGKYHDPLRLGDSRGDEPGRNRH